MRYEEYPLDTAGQLAWRARELSQLIQNHVLVSWRQILVRVRSTEGPPRPCLQESRAVTDPRRLCIAHRIPGCPFWADAYDQASTEGAFAPACVTPLYVRRGPGESRPVSTAPRAYVRCAGLIRAERVVAGCCLLPAALRGLRLRIPVSRECDPLPPRGAPRRGCGSGRVPYKMLRERKVRSCLRGGSCATTHANSRRATDGGNSLQRRLGVRFVTGCCSTGGLGPRACCEGGRSAGPRWTHKPSHRTCGLSAVARCHNRDKGQAASPRRHR